MVTLGGGGRRWGSSSGRGEVTPQVIQCLKGAQCVAFVWIGEIWFPGGVNGPAWKCWSHGVTPLRLNINQTVGKKMSL